MRGTILIVEDHDEVRNSLRDWLSSIFSECSFLEAKTGEEAMTLVQAKPPDIVLMDIGLPKMNGIEAASRIKGSLPQTKVVMLTIHEEPRYQTDAASAGANGYVVKRKMHSDLIPIMKKLLAQGGN